MRSPRLHSLQTLLLQVPRDIPGNARPFGLAVPWRAVWNEETYEACHTEHYNVRDRRRKGPRRGPRERVLTVRVVVCECGDQGSRSLPEESVENLQERVYNVILVLVNSSVSLIANDETETYHERRARIERFQSVLLSILMDLAKIKEQRKWLLIFFRDLNRDRIDRCVGRLAIAQEKFQIANQLHVEASQLRVEDLLDRIMAAHSALRPQLDRIEDIVKQFSQAYDAPHARKDMPLPHRIFCGRENLVDEITSLLATERTSRVCITGIGGMGKTSVAIAVVEKVMVKNIFPKEYVVWIPCVEAKSPDLLRRILYTQLCITAKSYDSLDPLITDLDTSKQRRLLLLDNFETPWLSGSGEDQAEIGDILVRLAKLPHIALLVTMTSGFIPVPGRIEWQRRELPALDADSARDAFRRKYRDAGGLEIPPGPELDVLLTAIGPIPLAITLVAACGGHQGTSAADLLMEWKSAGTRMMTGNETRSMDETIRLSMERQAVKSTPEALMLLAILSMLPAGTTVQNLSWWAPTLPSLLAAIDTLRTAALIEFQGNGHFRTSRIFVRPTVQSYMAHHNCISPEIRDQVYDACYDFVLRHKSTPDDHQFKSDLEALASEETNIQGLLIEIPVDAPRPKAIDTLIAFSLYQSWTKPSTVVAAHALKVARAAYDDLHVTDRDAAARRVAAAHEALAKSLFILDRYAEAHTHFDEAATRFKHLRRVTDLRRAGEASMQLVHTWSYISTESTDGLQSLVNEAHCNLSSDEKGKYHIARGLLGSGYFLQWSNRPDETLETLSLAKVIFEHLGCPASTAESLCLMARTHAQRGGYLKALPLAKAALLKAEQSGQLWLISRTLRVTARCLILSGHYEEASPILARCLATSQALGSTLGNSQGFELLGYNCAAMKDFSGARVGYEAARMEFSKIASTLRGRDAVDRCSINLEQLGRMAGMDQDGFSELIKPYPMY
ncbi:hypothetical protein C8R45DRAFT_562469 [Mycena sanguinolenta]|nr:hypothetical protein C8R45DRAFT_562469 [Mycena sanguinolenta]